MVDVTAQEERDHWMRMFNRTDQSSASHSDELFWLWAWPGRQMEALDAYKEAFSHGR